MMPVDDQLNLSLILPGIDVLWAETIGNPDICVAILDGPIDQSHPSFDGVRLSQLESFVSRPTVHGIATQHGTHVASVLFARHDSSVKGISPGCRGISIPVFSEDKAGSVLPCSQLDLARAVGQALDHGAHVINISGGELIPSGEPHPILAKAIQRCADNNVLIVAAAGNDGCQCLHVPAAAPTVLAVGATDAQGFPLASSNWGTLYEIQGILSPGENIPGVVPGGGISRKSGTSFAAPIVSGVVGLLLSLQLKRGEKPDPHGVRAALLQSAHACDPQVVKDCRRYMVGSLNIPGAYRLIKEGRILDQPTHSQAGPVEPVLADKRRYKPFRHDSQAVTGSDGASLVNISAVHPSGCGCKSCDAQLSSREIDSPQLVYAIGTLDADWESQARRDSFVQAMHMGNLNDASQLLSYLEEHPYAAESVIWTLQVQGTPFYAIKPTGPFAQDTYARLRDVLSGQKKDPLQRVSVPGTIAGKVRLLSGQNVPMIVPVLRGMTRWSSDVLVQTVLGQRPRKKLDQEQYDRRQAGLKNFLDRVYYELRNLGLSPGERALNFATTHAYEVGRVFEAAANNEMELDAIEVEPSPISRPNSVCMDVKVTLFDPLNKSQRARIVNRFTVDVSDEVPVTIGPVHSWSVY
jgi:hypothetical protein